MNQLSETGHLSVLFLTRYPVSGASSRYRVFQYIPHLEELGIACHVQPFMDERMYRLALKHGHNISKAWALCRAILARLWTLRRWREYDVIYLQRELLPLGPPWIERWLAQRGARIVFDYDDALFIRKPSRFNPLATRFRMADKTNELFGIARCTVAGNEWLRKVAVRNGGCAVTIEVAEDTSRFAPRDNRAHPITVGWLGSPSTVKYLRLIEASLHRLAARYPDTRWEIMGGGAFAMPGVPWSAYDWSMEGEVEALGRFDIGLMPLPEEEWALGKSGGKARTYMAAGVVPVVAAIGYNLELIQDGKTGFLCYDDTDWERVIANLIEHPEMCRTVGESARRYVTERFPPRGQAEKLAQVLRNVANGRNSSE